MAVSNNTVIPTAWRLDSYAINVYLGVPTADIIQDHIIIKYNKPNLNWLWHLNLHHLEPLCGFWRLLLSLPDKIARAVVSCQEKQFNDASTTINDVINIVRLNLGMVKDQTGRDVSEINLRKFFSHNVRRPIENDQGLDLEHAIDDYMRTLDFLKEAIAKQLSLVFIQDVGEKLLLMSDDLLRCVNVFLGFAHPVCLYYFQKNNFTEDDLTTYRNKISQILMADGGKILFHQFMRLTFWIGI